VAPYQDHIARVVPSVAGSPGGKDASQVPVFVSALESFIFKLCTFDLIRENQERFEADL